MAKISRDSDIVEITADPVFDYGAKVKSIKTIRNDGTYAGKDIGDVLVKKGDIGYVTSIGTFLQQFYIYAVDFVDTGHRVGMRGKELEAVATAAASLPTGVSEEAA
jgi:nitrogen fixation protein NifZ